MIKQLKMSATFFSLQNFESFVKKSSRNPEKAKSALNIFGIKTISNDKKTDLNLTFDRKKMKFYLEFDLQVPQKTSKTSFILPQNITKSAFIQKRNFFISNLHDPPFMWRTSKHNTSNTINNKKN